MLPRPTAIGSTISLASVDDLDNALHEMAWLTSKEKAIEEDARVRIGKIQSEAQSRALVEVEGKSCSIKDRWKALQDAVFKWCEKGLRAALPANKRSLELPHGAIKLRALPAAVALQNGAQADSVALGLAQSNGLLAGVDKLLKKPIDATGDDGQSLNGVTLNDLVSVKISLNKDAIKDAWAKRPEIHAFLRSLSISVESGDEQITVAPATLAVMTPDQE